MNAGKSTLFNALVKARAYAADQLFATLDTTTRQLYLGEASRSVSLSDTVGFIRDLPHGLIDAFDAAVGNGAARGGPGEQAFHDLDALGLGLVFGEAHPGHFGVGVGHAGDDAGIEGGSGQFLVALQFTGNHFSSHMRLMHRLVRQHGLAHDVADGEDVRHVCAHLDVDVDEAAVRHSHACLVGDNRKQVYFALSAVTGHKYATASEWRNWYAKTQSVPSSDPPHE